MTPRDLSQFSMLDLFRTEAESQAKVLTAGLLSLEREQGAPLPLESCMRAAHSLKGAARVVGLVAAVRIAHAMEDTFVAAQAGNLVLGREHIDRLLQGVDLLVRISTSTDAELPGWLDDRNATVAGYLTSLEAAGAEPGRDAAPPVSPPSAEPEPIVDASSPRVAAPTEAPAAPAPVEASDRVLRVTAENLNRLLGLASESLIESRWVAPFSASLLRLRRAHDDLAATMDALEQTVAGSSSESSTRVALAGARAELRECQRALTEQLSELDRHERRSTLLSQRLYDEALACRMRPFADAIHAWPRLVRDLAHSLGKEARLEVRGESTQVDRDILARLDDPLGHLLRNAVDHGLESPAERVAAGKPPTGSISLDAHHRAGFLHIVIADDGRGIDIDRLRTAVIARGLAASETARNLSEAELLEFLFLPGFTMKDAVTDTSGRGVGLDAVREAVKQVHGMVRVTTRRGRGAEVHLQLPVTLSVVRTLIVDIAGEPYAFPLAQLVRTLKVPKERVERVEGRPQLTVDGHSIGLVTAHQVLGLASPGLANDISAVVVGDGAATYAVVVDALLGERELVIQPLDAQFGKVRDIAGGSTLDDGSPVLIVDTSDFIRSIERLVSTERPAAPQKGSATAPPAPRKRVLVVDDSLTVREVQRKLLGNRGYDVDVAVDGMDGWNAVRTGGFNLVITDIDMPRMDGIELVTMINRDPQLRSVPVMVVSYKDRDEDRRRGLEAGAAYYLTKSSFQDETLVQAVRDLIGEADA